MLKQILARQLAISFCIEMLNTNGTTTNNGKTIPNFRSVITILKPTHVYFGIEMFGPNGKAPR